MPWLDPDAGEAGPDRDLGGFETFDPGLDLPGEAAVGRAGRLGEPRLAPDLVEVAEPPPDLPQLRARRLWLPGDQIAMAQRPEGFRLGEVDYFFDKAGVKFMRLVATSVICAAISGKRL
jgi:hypothetical protein